MSLTMRPARMDDWARLYAWRNDPEAAAQFLSGAVTLAEHLTWLRTRLAQPEQFLVAEHEHGHAVGAIRVASGGDVSVLVARECRRLGYATAMIRHLCSLCDPQTLSARVKTDNLGSLSAFAACGFVPSAVTDNLVVLTWSPAYVWTESENQLLTQRRAPGREAPRGDWQR